MSKNFNGINSPFDENVENGSPKTPSKKAEGKLKTSFEHSNDIASPFVDEVANSIHGQKVQG